jgi:hypothetical protein
MIECFPTGLNRGRIAALDRIFNFDPVFVADPVIVRKKFAQCRIGTH